MLDVSIASGSLSPITPPTTPPLTPHQKRPHTPDPDTDTKIQAVAQDFWEKLEPILSRLAVLRLANQVDRRETPAFINETEAIIDSLNGLLENSEKSPIFVTLGEIYSSSVFGKKHYPRAIAYYEKAADLGCFKSLLTLANLYLDSTSSEEDIPYIPKNQGKALEYTKKALKNHTVFCSPQDLYSIAQVLFKMDPTVEIKNYIIELLDKVIAHPDSSEEKKNASKQSLAKIYLGLYLPNFSNIDKVLETLEGLNDFYSEHLWGEVGEYYYNKKLFSNALDAFNKEVDQKPFAYTLFKIYHYGLGVEIDLKKAFTYLFENLAKTYSKSEIDELSLYKKKAILWLGMCYADGLGTEKNRYEGEKYLSYVEKVFYIPSDRLNELRNENERLFESQVADFKASI